MATLHHYPLCPHSRFVRLVLGEFGLDAAMVEERIWERRREFLELNPAGTTPVLREDSRLVIPGPGPIAEYLDETRGLALGERRLLPEGPGERIEVRRLLDWFNIKFNEEITAPLVLEKVMKRFMSRDEGGGPPEMSAIRAARGNVRYHLRYIAWLTAKRNWLAGPVLSYADLAAAAHLSCVDYLGDVPWEEDEAARAWYAMIKSRPSFRPLLSDRIPGMAPSAHYDDLDF
ncbi:glutathione S-transferase family protein [Bosea sp. NPDC055594]